MEPKQSSMQPDHVTLRDDTLTHQVRFSGRKGGQSVSCNCLATVGEHEKAGKLIYPSMGISTNLARSRELYNDPKNHNAPFTEGDKAKW